MYAQARHLLAGDSALSIELGDAISPEINRRVRDLLLAIDRCKMPGVIDLLPTYRSILVCYDPLLLTLSELEERLRSLEGEALDASVGVPKVVELPTVYGGVYGPDLDQVASHNELSPQEVIDTHAGTDYLVYMMGFTPGFPYLGGMSERIATPRLETPRTAIPAGSVGIAERQTGVYPVESPGGWRLIGRTPVRLFDAHREPPVVVDAGDYVRFVPVTEDRYLELQGQVEAGAYEVSERSTGS